MWKLIIHIFTLATIHPPIATLTPVMSALPSCQMCHPTSHRKRAYTFTQRLKLIKVLHLEVLTYADKTA